MTTTTFQVKGMSCEHCVRAVSGEIAELAGVTDVAVDLETGNVTVTSTGPIDGEAVRVAVDEAGYALVE